jgi:hypothetical protein
MDDKKKEVVIIQIEDNKIIIPKDLDEAIKLIYQDADKNKKEKTQ